MLSKPNRITSKELENVFKSGKSASSPNLVFKFIRNAGLPSPKIAFTAPKKLARTSPSRALLRRRGYAAIRKLFHLLPPDIMGVFLFRGEAPAAFGGGKKSGHDPFRNLQSEIETILRKL